MKKRNSEKLRTCGWLLFVLFAFTIGMFMGIEAITNSTATKFNLSTRFDAEVSIKVDLMIDSQYKTIFNSINPTSVDYTANYIDNILGDTINLNNDALPIKNNSVSLRLHNFETGKKVDVFINGKLETTLAKATDISNPSTSEIEISTLSTENLLGTILVSLKFAIIEEFTVHYISNSSEEFANIILEKGEIIPLPTPLDYDLKTFGGWYSDPNFETKVNANTTISSDIKLYAKWLDPFTITFATNGGSQVDAIQVKRNSTISSLPATVLTGYIFIDWYLDSNFSTPFVLNSTVVDADKTLYAKWQKEINVYIEGLYFSSNYYQNVTSVTIYLCLGAEYLLDSDGNIAGVRDNSALNNTSNAITQCTVEVNPTTNSYSLNNYKLDLGEYKLSIGEHVYFYCTQSGGNSLVMQNGSSPSSGFNEGQFANIHNGVTTVGGGILNGDDVYITLKFMKYNY